MHINELDTPALLVDLDTLDNNLRRAAQYARRHGLRLRPHTKTHKSLAVARLQRCHGAEGLTVAKVGEAEIMASEAPDDLLVAYPVIGARKLQRLAEVARRARVTVALDSLEAADGLSAVAMEEGVRIGVLAEMDAGLGRVGVAPGADLLELARHLSRKPGLDFRGIAFYAGHIKVMNEAGLLQLKVLSDLLRQVREQFRSARMPLELVSGGSTPTLFHSHILEGMNEIRPGTYAFNDRNTVACGACEWQDCAASVLCTVVSRAYPGQVILDGGSKCFSSDRLVTGDDGLFGRILEAPGARFWRMNEEHGFVDTKGVERTFSVGERLRIIPNHICVTVNLHERIYAVRGEQVVDCWPVEARGKLQ